MSSHQEYLQAMNKTVPSALDNLFRTACPELIQYFDKENVVQSIISSLRLTQPPIFTAAEANEAVITAFVKLFADAKIRTKFDVPLGSPAEAELETLLQVNGYTNEPESETVVADDYQDIVDIWNSQPAHVIGEKRRNPDFERRLNEAIAAGKIG